MLSERFRHDNVLGQKRTLFDCKPTHGTKRSRMRRVTQYKVPDSDIMDAMGGISQGKIIKGELLEKLESS